MSIWFLWPLTLLLGGAVGYASAAALRGRGRRFVAVGAPCVIIGVAAAVTPDGPWPEGIVVGIAVALGIAGLELGLASFTIQHGMDKGQPQRYLS